jgi:hypothetical protein
MSRDSRPEDEPSPPREGWDYSRHPLHAGGMQLRAVLYGVVATLLLMGLILIVLLLLQPAPGSRAGG